MQERKRLTKEELKEDEVLATTYRVIGYVENNYHKVLAYVGGVIVVVFIALYIQDSANKREQAALEALGSVRVALMQGQIEDAATRAEQIVREHTGSQIAAQATMTLGNAHFEAGRFEYARETFQTYLDENGPEGPDGFGAWVSIGSCMEQVDNAVGAAQHYVTYADQHPRSPFAPLALLEAARTYRFAGNVTASLDAYNRIMELYRDTPVRGEAASQIRMLEAAGS